MCGIAGIISLNGAQVQAQRVKQMTNVIAHRGPDGDGLWLSANGFAALGHRRLSIIDLSNEADQPMHYLDRYTMVFNGEIYNYIELKETLIKQGYTFKTSSDTEVLMALYDRHGMDCLSLLDGMFAFVIFDAQHNKLFGARDRFGEKPFFYSYEQNKEFLFGSELKCLWAGGAPKVVNQKMLFNYLSFTSIENPQDNSETFYNYCKRLPHAHFFTLDISTNEFQIKRYYEIETKSINASISVADASKKLEEIFYTSVQRRLRSDVPVGSSLSGGLDSSLIVCIIDELNMTIK
jgi:asparagine synthase (glutamine-hydrolysing)